MSNLIDVAYFEQNMTTLGLKSSFTPGSDALEVLIGDASDWVQNYCSRQLSAASVTDTIWLRNRQARLLLDQFPANSLTSITFDSNDGVQSLVDLALVRLNQVGLVEWKNVINGPFRNDGRYTVVYNAGYTVIPGAIKRATALKVADLMSPLYRGAQDREVNMVSDIEEKIIDLLEEYRRERLG